MKKNISTLIFIFLVAFGGCKKGEDDPAVSLLTRKFRLTGKWTAKSGRRYFEKNSKLPEWSYQETIITTENSYEQVQDSYYPGLESHNSVTGVFSYKLTFNKDGSFESMRMVDGQAAIIKGKWGLTGGIGKTKNKSQVIISADSSWFDNGLRVTTYGGNKTDYTYNIRELRNKKMVLFCETVVSSDLGEVETLKEEYVLEQ